MPKLIEIAEGTLRLQLFDYFNFSERDSCRSTCWELENLLMLLERRVIKKAIDVKFMLSAEWHEGERLKV